MTTMHVDEAALLDALAAYPVVRAVHADGDFPHRLRIQIVQYAPVGTVDVGGRPVPIASDGTVLRGADTKGLAALPAKSAPRTGHVTDPRTVRAVRLLAAAPPALRDHVARVLTGPKGLTVRVERGPALIFGNATRTPAKWAAAVAVLADPSSAGATSIDLRVPERPTAAGLEQIAEQEAADGGAAVTTTPAQDGTAPTP
jgi:cell division septal protein FtsQ